MVFGSKRGMSPLIATVLLIAFAVALGTMIMNWSSGIDAEAGLSVCKDVSFEVTQPVCAGQNALTMVITNNGMGRIDGMEVGLGPIAGDSEVVMRVKDSHVLPGETMNREFAAFVPSLDLAVKLTPLIASEDGSMVVCEKTSACSK